jgi:hypothetical protein
MSLVGNAARLISRYRHSSDPRDCILIRVPRDSVCAEVGVYKGDFSERILRIVHPKKLHLIDPWKFEPGPAYEDSWYGGPVGESQSHMDGIYDSVMCRFSVPIRSGMVEVHRSSSADCSSLFPDNYFDWIYIDGNHRYEFVKQDIQAYLPKIKAGGLIAGDDYGNRGWWQDGVTKAVDEIMRSGKLERVLIKNQQFLFRKPPY